MRGNRVVLRRGAILLGAFLAILIGAVDAVHAQIVNGNLWPNPRLLTLTPTGGKVGSTVEVAFSGSDLDRPESLLFSHPGIKATPVIPPPPKVDPKAKPDPKKPDPGPPPITRFSVVIAKDVPLGFYDVRLVNKFGVSNPRIFVVGDLEEVAEKEPNNDIEQAHKVEMGTTITGVIAAPTDVDYTSFLGKKGQRVLVSCLTASIDSRLHPEMRIFDSDQRQVAYNRPMPGKDGLVDVTLPADGLYFIRLNQFTYTLGTAEYFYRLDISTGPWIDAIFPPIVEPGKATALTIYGRNLPGGKLDPEAILDGKMLEKSTATVTGPGDPAAQSKLEFSGLVPPPQALLDGFEFRLKTSTAQSNPYLLALAQAPLIIENDKNDTPETAQEIKTPCELAGRIDKKRDRDWFAFDAKKGDVFIIEVQSNRLGAPTDMYFSLRNLTAKSEITLQDDNPETLSGKGFYTVTKDPPPFRFVVPADGKFHLLLASHIGDILTDPQHMYRLRITPEKPDFRLFVMPSEDYRPDACQLGQGGVQNYQIFVHRTDGFKGDITLEMEGLPPGVTCPPQVIAGAQKTALLAVLAADNAAPFTGTVKVKATATIINGQKVIREARPATITWPTQPQQNIATVTRLDRGLMLAVRDKAPAKLTVNKDKLVVSLGDKADLSFKLIRHDANFKGNFQVQPVGPELPVGVTFGNLTFVPGKDDQQTALTVAPNAIPGTYNLVFRGFAPIAPDPKGKPVNTILPSTPIQLTILPKQVANLSVDNANPTIKLGADGVVIVKVARLFDYNDAFKVKLVLPKDVQGIAADEITIPPGQNEAKLTLKVPANTPPGARQNLTIQATAVVNGNVTLTHETKINVNLVK
jgi:hypothetical protein